MLRPSSFGCVSMMRVLTELAREPLEDVQTELRVHHLAPTEHDRDLDLGVGRQEAHDVLLLGLVVVLVDLRPELDLFDLDLGLVLARELLLLSLLVLELAVVHDAADRRIGERRDLDEVEILLIGDPQSIRDREDAELAPVDADQTTPRRADALVEPRFRTAADRQLTSVVSGPALVSGPVCSHKTKLPRLVQPTGDTSRENAPRPARAHHSRDRIDQTATASAPQGGDHAHAEEAGSRL